MINTISGMMAVNDLGIIAPHEHIFINITNQYPGKKDIYGIDGDNDKVNIKNLGELRRNCYLLKDNLLLDDVDIAIFEAEYFKRAGGRTIVDLTPVGVGRDVHKLKKVADATGLNIIVGCGLYTHDAIPAHLEKMNLEQLSEHYIRELTVGIDSTNIKAGVIGEIGTSNSIYPVEERALRAAAIANMATGAPIYIHTYPWGHAALEALDIIEVYGVEASNICVCHLDVQFDYAYMISVLERGAYLEFDDFGKEFYIFKSPDEFAGGAFASDVERIRMLIKLIDEGWEDKLLLANDVCLKTLLHTFGGWGYDHIYSNIVPMMLGEGINMNVVKKMIELNPIRFLAGRIN